MDNTQFGNSNPPDCHLHLLCHTRENFNSLVIVTHLYTMQDNFPWLFLRRLVWWSYSYYLDLDKSQNKIRLGTGIFCVIFGAFYTFGHSRNRVETQKLCDLFQSSFWIGLYHNSVAQYVAFHFLKRNAIKTACLTTCWCWTNMAKLSLLIFLLFSLKPAN